MASLSSTVADFRSNYTMNSTINGVEEADVLLIIGSNPRHEAAIVNSRIRKAWLEGMDVAVVGKTGDLNYEYDAIASLNALSKHPFMKKLLSAKTPMVLVGSSVFELSDSTKVLGNISKIVSGIPGLFTPQWNGFNVLQRAASWTAALDIGFLPHQKLESPKLAYLLNADNIRQEELQNAFVIYQGHHGDAGAHMADVILPGSAYTEKGATYVNTEGRAQVTRAAVAAPGAARDDWQIVRALSEVCNTSLPYDDITAMRKRLADVSPNLVEYDMVRTSSFTKLGLEELARGAGITDGKVGCVEQDFYLTDVICRASSTMAKCSRSFTHLEGGDGERLIAC